MNDYEKTALQKVAVFSCDVNGRGELAQFQKYHRIVGITSGEFVNNMKKQPCLWVLYIPGLDPFIEQKEDEKTIENDLNTGTVTKSKRSKVPKD